MNALILHKTPKRRSLHPLVGLRLEFWNGVQWECGHPEHRNMTEESWCELKPKIKHWSCPWRLVASRVECKSRKQPNDKLRHAAPDAQNSTDGQSGVA